MIENIPRRRAVRGRIMGPTNPVAGAGRFALHRDPHPARVATFAEDVGRGLSMRPYTLMPKYFYDDLGSALFEAITYLPEYYLTRVERDLLATYSAQIVAAFDEPLELVELGSGSATKTRLIIDADVPSDRHLARRADRVVACARCRARYVTRARLCRRLFHAAAREARRDA